MPQDPTTPPPAIAGTLEVVRDARVFTLGQDRVRELAGVAAVHRLLAGQRLELGPPCDLVVRQGNLRVSEFLPDGREVTRAVLQTGMVCRLREPLASARSERGDSPLYSLAATALAALGETEIWQLPAGAYDQR
ncbi:MAG: hypothetical protein R3D98_00935 [Candidatus Krumholzibacteriia bacterium]